jgi:hypothetical protein
MNMIIDAPIRNMFTINIIQVLGAFFVGGLIEYLW